MGRSAVGEDKAMWFMKMHDVDKNQMLSSALPSCFFFFGLMMLPCLDPRVRLVVMCELP